MVGSRDYFDEEIDGNFNVTTGTRQPGSSIKPFVYASAWQKGYLPDTVLFDVPTQFSNACDPWQIETTDVCYSPKNYNSKFVGPVSMRNSLAQSLNIPAVKTLYLTGIEDTLKFTADMGLTTLDDPVRYGLTLVLGGGEVRLLDMTHAYGVFANEGIKAEPRTILRIEDIRGNVLEETEVEPSRVLDANVAAMVSDVLSDEVARAPLWGSFSLVDFNDRDVAIKSGSTNDLRDAWIMGYAPNIAVGSWVGNNDNSTMGGGLSGLITTPMWREFMDVALAELPVETFPQPQINKDGVKPVIRGSYATPQIETSSTSPNFGSISSGAHSILHYVDKNNPTGPYPTNPANDGAYRNWEYGIQNWNRARYSSILQQLQALQAQIATTDDSQEEPEPTESEDSNNTENNESDN